MTSGKDVVVRLRALRPGPDRRRRAGVDVVGGILVLLPLLVAPGVDALVRVLSLLLRPTLLCLLAAGLTEAEAAAEAETELLQLCFVAIVRAFTMLVQSSCYHAPPSMSNFRGM